MKNTFEAIEQEYLENAVLLLKQDGFFLKFSEEEKAEQNKHKQKGGDYYG